MGFGQMHNVLYSPPGTIHNGPSTLNTPPCTPFVVSYSPFPKAPVTTDTGLSIPAVLPFPEGHMSGIML